VSQTDRLRIAVFIDFDNIEIGVRNTLNATFDVGLVLEALKERGEVVSKMAYSDWQRAGSHSRALTQHAIRMVQRNLTPGGDKNGADINLALDALEMAFTHPHINAFVIVGGDSDFISLVEKLKQYDKQVFIVGGRQFTSGILQRNCHEFIAYEHLAGAAPPSGKRSAGRETRNGRGGVERLEQAVPLVARALKVLSERDVSPQLGLLKTTLLQLDSTFSERAYGAGSFRDFAQKLEKMGALRLSQGKGGWLVAPADGLATGDTVVAPAEEPGSDRSEGRGVTEPAELEPRSGPIPVLGTPADGVREFARMLVGATVRRWPLYLRNVKQIIKQSAPAFDERAFGFANLTDLLRAAHREGIVRVDRDRQGVVRVFQGAAPGPDAALDARPAAAPADDLAEIEPALLTEESTGQSGAADGGDVSAGSDDRTDGQPAASDAAPETAADVKAPRSGRRRKTTTSSRRSRSGAARSTAPAGGGRRRRRAGSKDQA